MPGKGKILMGKGPVKRPTPVKPKPSYEKLKDFAKKAGKILPVDKKYASDTNNKMKAAAGPKKKPVMPPKKGGR